MAIIDGHIGFSRMNSPGTWGQYGKALFGVAMASSNNGGEKNDEDGVEWNEKVN